MPTVARWPLGPMVNFAPRSPNERDPPDLLKFRVTPGAILIRLQNRKPIFPFLLLYRRRPFFRAEHDQVLVKAVSQHIEPSGYRDQVVCVHWAETEREQAR